MIGMPPATAASKLRATPFFSARRRQLGAVFGEQRLVGRHHVLARSKRGLDRCLCGAVVSADQFDEDINGCVGRKPFGLFEPVHPFDADAALLAARAGAHTGDHDVAPDRLRQPSAVRLQQTQQAGTHGAKTGNTQSQRLAHLPAV